MKNTIFWNAIVAEGVFDMWLYQAKLTAKEKKNHESCDPKRIRAKGHEGDRLHQVAMF